MCVNCSYSWKTQKSLGAFYWGWGQICEDRSSWLLWLRISHLYLGLMPATCYWKWPDLTIGSTKGWRLGGGQVRRTQSPRYLTILAGPFDFSWKLT